MWEMRYLTIVRFAADSIVDHHCSHIAGCYNHTVIDHYHPAAVATDRSYNYKRF